MITDPAPPSATPPASAEELRAISEGFNALIKMSKHYAQGEWRNFAIIAQLCEEKAAALEQAQRPFDDAEFKKALNSFEESRKPLRVSQSP